MDFPKSVPGVGLVDGKFVDENQTTGQVGSLIPSTWGNAVTEELLNVIQAAGLEPDEEQKDQLLQAVRKLRGGAVNFGLWQFSAAGGNPGAGRVTLNNGDPALASALLIAESSAEALDYSPSLGMLRAGDTLSLQERDAIGVSHRFRVTGPAVDHGAYREIPVSYVSGSGGAPAVDAMLSVLFSQASAYDDSALSGRVSSLEARPRAIGDGQTWQNLTASRAFGITYTNSTGRPIYVQISSSMSTGQSVLTVAGVQVVQVTEGAESNQSIGAVVPPGATYSATGALLQIWAELR